MKPAIRSFCSNDPWSRPADIAGFTWYLTKSRMALKYRNTFFGYIWSLLTPLAGVAIYYVVFRFFFRAPPSPAGVPFFAVFLSGFFFWDVGSRAVNEASYALIEMAHVLRNVRFPRYAAILSSILSNALHGLVALPLVVAALWVVGVPPGPGYLLLPVAYVLLLLFLTGLGLMLGVLAVFYNDLLHFIQIVLNAAFFMSPVIYTVSSLGLPDRFKLLYVALWPPASLIEFGRAALLGAPLPLFTAVAAAGWALFFFVAGAAVFLRGENAMVLRL